MSCRHFEVEGLARVERDVPDPHTADCADCQAARDAYLRLGAALAETGAGYQPRAGWEDRVWAAVDHGPSRGARAAARLRWGWVAGGAVLAAAAVVLLVWRPWRDPAGSGPAAPAVAIQYEVIRGPTAIRGTSATVGDSLSVRYPAAGAALWIYQGERRLRIQCDAGATLGAACRPDGDGVAALVVADAPGTYHVLGFTRAMPMSAPATLDEGLAALTRAQVRFEQREFEVY